MMIESVTGLPPGCLGLRAKGQVTRDDYQRAFEPLLTEAHRKGERIRLLYELGSEFEGFTPGAAWEDARLGLHYLRLFERCAIVTDVQWVQQAARFAGSLLPFPTKIFSLPEREEAIAWLAQETSAPSLRHRLLPDKGVLILEPLGPLSAEDFEALALTVDPWIESEGQLRGVVVHARRFPGWENLGAVWGHLRFVREHHRKLERVAVAADGGLADLGPMLARLVGAEARHFDYDQFEEALAWASG